MMSTKSTLYYSEELHLYNEYFKEKLIFLKLKKPNLNIEIEFSIEDFAKIAKTIDFKSLEKQSNLTDEQIVKYCARKVKERICEDNFLALLGYSIFGDNRLTEEEQIQNGFNYFVKERDKLKKLFEEINKSNAGKHYFGLEDILEN